MRTEDRLHKWGRTRLGAEYIDFADESLLTPVLFGRIGRFHFGLGSTLGLECGHGGGRFRMRLLRLTPRRAACIAWEVTR